MPVKKDSSGKRFVQAEVEVPGTPEEVWKAIATGPGISSWFVPSEVDERAGGTAISHFGPGTSMDSIATIKEWRPPHRFTMETNELGENAPAVATEWIVEARSGGTCTVRVVHSWFATTDDWDNQFEGHEQGWVGFFRILRLYLTHYRGQKSAAFQLMAFADGAATDVWRTLTDRLGFSQVAAGLAVRASSDAPPIAGTVVHTSLPQYPEVLVHLHRPAAGAAHLFAMPMGGSVCLSIRVFFYGDGAATAAARAEPQWKAWFNEVFPATAASSVMQGS